LGKVALATWLGQLLAAIVAAGRTHLSGQPPSGQVAAPTKLVVLAAAAADLQARYLTNQTQTQQPLSFLETLAVLELKVPTGLVVVVVVLAELARLRPSTLLVDLEDPGLCQTFLEPQPVMQLVVAVELDLQRFPAEALADSAQAYLQFQSSVV
jgi:hypothetical protein